MKISYQTSFIRQLKKLGSNLKEEVLYKIKLFEVNPKDKSLKLHKLKGKLKDKMSFSESAEKPQKIAI